MRDIGKNIKHLRIAQEMTQDQLAERLFVTRQTVSNYENGKSEILAYSSQILIPSDEFNVLADVFVVGRTVAVGKHHTRTAVIAAAAG